MPGRKTPNRKGSLDFHVSVTGPDEWPVPYTGGMAIWRRFSATFDAPGWPVVELDIVVDDGKPSIDRLELRGRPTGDITSGILREVSIRHLLDLAVGAAVLRRTPTKAGGFVLTPIQAEDADRADLSGALGRQLNRERRERRKGRPATPPSKVERVLALWAEAAGKNGRADWVAKRAGVSRTKVYEIVRDEEGGH